MVRDSDHDERLDSLITPECVEGIFSAALWAAAAKRGIAPNEDSAFLRREALQRLYKAGFDRGRRETLSRLADDGK